MINGFGWALILLQVMSLGMLIAKVGDKKEGTYGSSDIIASLISISIILAALGVIL